jgi:phage tail sheath protein FI
MSPGNIPLAGVVGLTPGLSPALLPPGAVAQLNVLSAVPIGFVSLSAWTMSTDDHLNEINVRRLLCELRRMALLLGPRYVFEPNGTRLVHAVTRDFEALLTQLFSAGAFAGATPATSYFLNVQTGADSTSGLDRAQLRAQIGVAPSVPLRFLTVQLTQEAGGVTHVGGS